MGCSQCLPARRKKLMPEIVYVLTNEAMEGMVKIGRTTTSVEQRIRELDNTSMPLPFCVFISKSCLIENFST